MQKDALVDLDLQLCKVKKIRKVFGETQSQVCAATAAAAAAAAAAAVVI
jgi:hypothetical protein